jgi:hypothetical protein
MAPGQTPEDFAKFFYGTCHVTVCGAGDAEEVNRSAPEEIRQSILAAFFASVD